MQHGHTPIQDQRNSHQTKHMKIKTAAEMRELAVSQGHVQRKLDLVIGKIHAAASEGKVFLEVSASEVENPVANLLIDEGQYVLYIRGEKATIYWTKKSQVGEMS